MPTPPAACTNACTSEAENANADTFNPASHGTPLQDASVPDTDKREGMEKLSGLSDVLARFVVTLLTLSPSDRARLARMLLGNE
jgi:hypothetical protein